MMENAGHSKVLVQITRTTMGGSVVMSEQTLSRWYVDDLDAQAVEIAVAEALTMSPTHTGGADLEDHTLTAKPESA